MFGSTNTFGQPLSSPFGSSQSLFGQPSSTAFGSSQSLFGQPSSTPVSSSQSLFGMPSSSPFDSSQSLFGQQINPGKNPFAPKPFGSPTPLGSQTGNSEGVVGATQTLSSFSSKTNYGASSSPTFHSLMPAFGVSYTPSFCNSLPSSGAFGQKPAFEGRKLVRSPFGSAIQPPQPAFGSNTQQPKPAFVVKSLFDSSPTPAFSFGSSTQASGQSSSAFGTSNPFGSTTSAFGGQSSAFASHTPTQTFENTGIGQSEFGGQRGGSRVASYSATTVPDGTSGQLGKFESISTMSDYKDKSHEELRWEDYQLGDKGGPLVSDPQSTGMAGFKSYTTQTNAFSRLVSAQSSANPVSSATPNSNKPFAPKTSTVSSGFGTSAPAFSSSAFVSSSTSAFGTSSSLASGASSIPTFGFCPSTEACGQSSSSSAFGGQSYVVGPQIHTQAFVNTGIGQSGFVGQRGGSRVASYSATTEENSGPGKLDSISAMPFYKDKNHEELRWEDYQLGTKAFGQSSSRPFCSSQSVFGQQNNSSNNPSASKPFGTSAGVFGATQTLSPFSSNTTSSASSSPAFNSSMPTSGASSTPAFGNSSAPYGGGLSVVGLKPAFGGFHSTPTQTSPFGRAIQPPQQAFGSNTQQSRPAFGRNIFDSSTLFCASSQPAFGSTGATSTPAFASTSTPAFGATSTPAFGSTSTPAFGSTSSPAFGATITPAFGSTSSPAFGATSSPAFAAMSNPAFGSTSSPAFGATSTPAYGTTTPTFSFGSSTPTFGQSSSAFGTSSPIGSTTSAIGGQSFAFGSHTPTQTFKNTGTGKSEFGRQQGGSRVASYSATTEPDGASEQLGKFQSISTMSYYKDKSHEELKWEDYQLGDKGGPIASAPQSTGVAGFNSSTTQTNAFGPSPTFGQSSANPFSSTTPNSNNPFAQKTSPFNSGFAPSAPAFSSSGFGTTTSAAAPSNFGQPSTSPFGANSSSQSFSSTPSIFGPNSSSQPFGVSTSSPFGSTMFGNTQSSPLFSSSAPTSQSVPAFGQNTSPFGQNGAFSQPSLFNQPSSGLAGSIFSSSTSMTSNALTGFGQTTPSMSSPFQTAQPSLFNPPSSAFGSSSTSAFGTSSSLAFAASSIPAFSSAFSPCYPFGSSTSALGDTDIRSSGQTEKLESISASLLYKDKSHEELRWEDYQLGSSASTNVQSGSEFGQNTFPFGQTAGFRPSSFFSSLSSGLVGSIVSSRASLTSNAPDWVVSYQGRGSTVPLAVLTGTVLATVVVSGWISLRCKRA